MLNIIIALLLGCSFAFAGPREEATDILGRFNAETDLVKRLDLISKIFIGLPYGKTGPLGEGPEGKYDQDPLYRFDTFDCTTYVETIMALALARDIHEFEESLNHIRYENGEIDYLKRNHFTDLQWIPFNIKNGFMSEINQYVVNPAAIKMAEALVNLPGWIKSLKTSNLVVPMASEAEKNKLLQELHAEAFNYKAEMARVPYITISSIVSDPKILNQIPSGTIVNFVRPNWDLTDVAGTHQNISHQGFLFKMGKILYLRHASTAGNVQQLPFIDYLKKFVNHPTLKGIHLMKLNQP
jgi:hypothetical protein